MNEIKSEMSIEPLIYFIQHLKLVYKIFLFIIRSYCDALSDAYSINMTNMNCQNNSEPRNNR